MPPHIVFALEQEGAATKSPNSFKNFIVSCTLCACANGTSSTSFPLRFSYLIFSVVFSFFFMHACVLWCFPKSQNCQLMQNWPAGPVILKNEIGFFQELLMENDFLRTWYLGFD